MPIGVLLVRPFGLLVQVVRGAMIGALSSAYVKTARAKGVGEERVIFIHALRNSMLAVITVASDQAAGLLNGAVIVETVFGFPGVGKLMIDAIIQRDFALVQAAIIVTAAAIFILNILVDIAYAVARPAHPASLRWRARKVRRRRFPSHAALSPARSRCSGATSSPAPRRCSCLLMAFCAVFGPALLGDVGTGMNLKMRNAPPGSIQQGWMYILGADALGRPILPRIIVAAQNTIGVATAAVVVAMVAGGVLGLVAGYSGGWLGTLIMRFADIIMSFPSLLLAVVILYMFEPRVANLVLVLAITRMPVYIRTTRAEVLEIRERMYVNAARVLGASTGRILARHIAPLVVPTLITVATLDFAFVMLAESALSFLGIGIQPPEVTWGLMVAQGRNYLNSAWWLAFFPGLAIMLTTLALNLLSGWVRLATDPQQRWQLEIPRRRDG